MNRQRWRYLFILMVGLLFLVIGQHGLFYDQCDRPEPLKSLFLGVALLLGLSWRLRRQSRRQKQGKAIGFQAPLAPWYTNPRVLWSVAALLLSLEAALATHDALPWSSSRLVGGGAFQTALWMLAMLGFTLLFVCRDDWQRGRQFVRRHRDEFLLLAALLALALTLRLPNLGGAPWPLAQDEGQFGVQALDALDGQRTHPFFIGHLHSSGLFSFWQATAMRLLGKGVVGLRLPAALAGAFLLLPVYALGRLWLGRRAALIAALLIAVSHFPLHYSRVGLNLIMDPLLAATALALLTWALRSNRQLGFALAGLALGFSQYFAASSRLTLLLAGSYLLFKRRKYFLQSEIKENVSEIRLPDQAPHFKHGLLTLLAGLLIAFAPLLWAYLESPDLYLRPAQESDVFATGWLTYTKTVTGRGTLDLLANQFTRSLLAFNFYEDRAPSRLYNPPGPLLDPFSGVLWLFGLLLVWRRRRSAPLLTVLIWVLGTAVLGGALIQDPPSSPHLLFVSPALALLAALGLAALVDVLAQHFAQRDAGRRMLIGVCLMLAAINVYFYGALYTPQSRYATDDDSLSTQIGQYLALRAKEGRIYAIFVGPPQLSFQAGPSRFLAFDVPGRDQIDAITEEFQPDLQETDFIFIFLPERQAELDALRRACPQGRELNFFGKYQKTFNVYELKAQP